MEKIYTCNDSCAFQYSSSDFYLLVHGFAEFTLENLPRQIDYLSYNSFRFNLINKKMNDIGLKLDQLIDFLDLKQIKGIDLSQRVTFLEIVTNLRISNYSKLDAYYNNQRIQDSQCLYLMEHSLFAFNVTNLIIGKKIDNIYNKINNYTDQICPLIFQNSIIKSLTLMDLYQTNTLKFIQINSSINSNIERLNLFCCEFKIDLRLIDQFVFENLIEIEVRENLTGIDKESFKFLNNLQSLYLNISNLNYFIKTDMDWLGNLNYKGIQLDIFNSSDLLNQKPQNDSFTLKFNPDFVGIVESDENFCYFKNFPHDRLIVVSVESDNQINCGCLIVWLILNLKIYESQLDFDSNALLYCLKYSNYNESFYDKAKLCNFNHRLEQCNKSGLKELNYTQIIDSLQLTLKLLDISSGHRVYLNYIKLIILAVISLILIEI